MSNIDNTSNGETPHVSEESIRDRAYQIYVHRGGRDGHADGDWYTAEAELKELKRTAEAVLAITEK